MVFHNGYRTLSFKAQVVQVHLSTVLKSDDEGKFPDYTNKINKLNINKLSGGIGHIEEHAEGDLSDLPKKDVTAVPDDRESRIQAARERFLARKVNK
ncbi:hypothetical protein M0R45_016012 [Rubus argutus]|uniref:Uncharacterized protein n=1 Tax=Rubus argutus TaxID=59490 RepID=A0AAW1XTV9_RUBAR